ncbi:hypothetical protein Dcar01_02844 [Deinococcus carri]|uniref:DUF2239 domain-containing protein n=1 Tax=Deinococcus carri TaxID=1211323 RepID=A0ABP9W9R3_9DEIO
MDDLTYTAFRGASRLFRGSLRDLLIHLKTQQNTPDPTSPLLLFEDWSGRQVDFDLRGTLKEVLERSAPTRKAGPGRPRLGVVSREVSLLPRHWEWLETQRGGASAALRRLVDEARRVNPDQERVRQAQAAAGGFMTVMAGDQPGFEEATRALYARDEAAFAAHTATWPAEIRAHARQLADPAFPTDSPPDSGQVEARGD